MITLYKYLYLFLFINITTSELSCNSDDLTLNLYKDSKCQIIEKKNITNNWKNLPLKIYNYKCNEIPLDFNIFQNIDKLYTKVECLQQEINKQIPIITNNSNNTSCNLCNDIVNIINGELHIANSTINIIEHIVKGFCSLIIIPLQKKECFFLLNHIQDIINMLINGLSPKDICIKLGFCS